MRTGRSAKRQRLNQQKGNCFAVLRWLGMILRTGLSFFFSENQLDKHTQHAYTKNMKSLFVELPSFSRHRADYLDDEGFRDLQNDLMKNSSAGDVIEGTGGLRKMRHSDPRRGKGKRGGLRVIYFWWEAGRQFWLFTLYNKDEMDDMSSKERKALKEMLKFELEARR